jgi:hypothetical protein
MKTCSKCNIDKPFEMFYISKNSKCGYRSACKDCLKKYDYENKDRKREYNKKYNQENSGKISHSNKKYYENNRESIIEKSKVYYKCNKDERIKCVKQYRELNRDVINKKCREYRILNKDKISKINKQYQLNNKERIVKQRKDYYESNRDHIRCTAKEYYQANKDDIIKYSKEYYQANRDRLIKGNKRYIKKRLMEDQLFKFRVNTRGLIKSSFKRGNNQYKKNAKTEGILCCTINEFKDYISSKFTNGMTLDNHGEWHLDHIIPLATASTEEEIIKLNHYTNFQPLWAKDNLSKGSKIILK